MKKIVNLLLPLLLFSCQPSYAEEGLELTKCEQKAYLAEQIMLHRQTGTPKEDVLSVVKGDKSSQAKEFVQITNKAYEKPIGTSIQRKAERVLEFSDQVYYTCKANLDMVYL